MTLERASIIVDKALAKAWEAGYRPMCVAVLDQGGHLKALKREDNARKGRKAGSDWIRHASYCQAAPSKGLLSLRFKHSIRSRAKAGVQIELICNFGSPGVSGLCCN